MYKNIPVIYIVALWIKKPQNIIAKSTSKKTTQGVFSNHKLKKARQQAKHSLAFITFFATQADTQKINVHSWFITVHNNSIK